MRLTQLASLTLAAALAGVASPLLMAQPAPAGASPSTGSRLPQLGDGSELGSSAERRLGDRIARELYRDPDYIDDPIIMAYVQSIWQPLLAAARMRGDLSNELDQQFAWEIFLGKDRTINAFALPGGYLGLHLGLVGVVTSGDELASVLAHELSHVTQRHISRLISKQSSQTPWLIGAMILGALAASKNPDAANAVIVGGQAAAAQNQLNFSRDMEREADRNGFGVLTQAGFDSRAFASMFDKLQQSARLNDSGSYPYLRSHPLTTERMADMQARQQQDSAAHVGVGVGDIKNVGASLVHTMVSARARVLSDTKIDALRAWGADADAKTLATAPLARQVGVLYGASLAAAKLRDRARTEAYWQRLSALVRTDAMANRLAHLLAVELNLVSADEPATSSNNSTGLALQRPELILWAQAVLRSSSAAPSNPATPATAQGKSVSQISQVAQRLQTWVVAHPRDATAWQLLSSTYAAQGQTLRAIRADAEMQVAQLDYAAAADRLKAAQELVRSGKAGNDHIEASIIDSRANAVQLLLREQALER